ncbi:MAG: hypothetical protein WAK31_27590 [Chthoniobacterales bacterium]
MAAKKSAFKIDGQSGLKAQQLTDELFNQHLLLVEKQSLGSLRELDFSSVDGTDLFFQPLQSLANQIPLEDVRIDLRDFGLFVALMKDMREDLVAVQINEGKITIPVLPSAEMIGLLLRSNGRAFDDYLSLAKQVNWGRGKPRRISWREASEAFFGGLRSFLAARISGFLWQNKRSTGGPSWSGPSAAVRGGSPPPTSGGSGQWWAVHTKSAGLSLYYGGTHVIRTPGIYLNGTTTPLNVFLPMGTLYLAADAGPGGGLIWDIGKGPILVPSFTPTYKTSAF